MKHVQMFQVCSVVGRRARASKVLYFFIELAKRARLSTREHIRSRKLMPKLENMCFFEKRAPRRAFSFKSLCVIKEKRSRAFLGKDVMTMDHENAKPCSTHQPSWCKVRKNQSVGATILFQKNFASRKHLKCAGGAKFVHTKQNHQSWHPNRCAWFLRKNFAFFGGCLIEVSFKFDNLKFLDDGFCSKVLFHLEEKNTWFCKFLTSFNFLQKPRKTARESQILKKNLMAVLGFRTAALTNS